MSRKIADAFIGCSVSPNEAMRKVVECCAVLTAAYMRGGEQQGLLFEEHELQLHECVEELRRRCDVLLNLRKERK